MFLLSVSTSCLETVSHCTRSCLFLLGWLASVLWDPLASYFRPSILEVQARAAMPGILCRCWGFELRYSTWGEIYLVHWPISSPMLLFSTWSLSEWKVSLWKPSLLVFFWTSWLLPPPFHVEAPQEEIIWFLNWGTTVFHPTEETNVIPIKRKTDSFLLGI